MVTKLGATNGVTTSDAEAPNPALGLLLREYGTRLDRKIRERHPTGEKHARSVYEESSVFKNWSPEIALPPPAKNRDITESDGTIPLWSLYYENPPPPLTVISRFTASRSRSEQLLLLMNSCVSFWKKVFVFLPGANGYMSPDSPLFVDFCDESTSGSFIGSVIWAK